MPSIYTPDPTNSAQPLDTDYAYLQAAELRTLKGYLQTQLAGLGGPVNGSMFKNINQIINGDFYFTRYIYQGDVVATYAMTTPGYGLFDCWRSDSTISGSLSKIKFTPGQTAVPGNPNYHARITKGAGSSGISEYCKLSQRIEDVTRSFGQTYTLEFYAKADASKNLSVEFVQNFGTGGTPTAEVTGIGVSAASKFALTTSWQKFQLTITAPAAPGGLVLGSNINDYFELNFWVSAGSNFNTRTESLGNQTGTFDISRVRLVQGGIASDIIELPLDQEESRCARYLPSWFDSQGNVIIGQGNAITTTTARIFVPHNVPTRGYPTGVGPSAIRPSVYNGAGAAIATSVLPSIFATGRHGSIILATVAAGLTAGQGTAMSIGSGNSFYLTGCEL